MGSKSEIRVLLAEDDPDQLRLLATALQDVGYRVETAENGRVALERAAMFRPDVVAADILMPEMGGVLLCRTMRHDPDFEDIPFLFITAYAERIPSPEKRKERREEYMIKPLDVKAFVTRVGELAEKSEPGDKSPG